MKITSQPSQVNASISQLNNFLCDCHNYIYLLPQDQISEWKAEAEWCSFKVQGGILITLVLDKENTTDNTIKLKSGEKSPFPFQLTINLKEINDITEGYIIFDGDVNVFLKMMIERPLTNLFNTMTGNLKLHFQASN
jgi:hypothetical protein